jgi:hypothetical protein
MTGAAVKIVAEVILILAVATKEVIENNAGEY